MSKMWMTSALVLLLACGGVMAQEDGASEATTQPGTTQPSTQPADPAKMFRITPAASRVLLSVMQSRKLDFDVYAVRISAETDPDGKVSYRLDITDQTHENDVTIIARPLRFLIDRAHIPLLEGITIDYRKGPAGEGFVFLHNEPATEEAEGE